MRLAELALAGGVVSTAALPLYARFDGIPWMTHDTLRTQIRLIDLLEKALELRIQHTYREGGGEAAAVFKAHVAPN